MGPHFKAIIESFNTRVVQTRSQQSRTQPSHQCNEVAIGYPDGHTCIFKVEPGTADDVASNLREWLKQHLADNGVAFSCEESRS